MKSFEMTQKMMKEMNSPGKIKQMMRKMNLNESDFDNFQ
jgi:hypothetical protein